MCQILCVDGDLQGNLQRIEAALEEAAARQAQIACFPESAILGWVNPDAHALADSIPGPTTDRLGAMARRHGMMICIGLDEKSGGHLYDAAVLIGADGAVLLKQRKIDNLAHLKLMDPPYADGRPADLRVVDTPLGRIGIAICADAYDEAIVRRIGAAAPDLLLATFAWAAEADRWPRHGEVLARIVARAAQQARCPVIGTNRVGRIAHGPWAGRIYGGQSVAADARGNILVTLRDRDDEVRVLQVTIGSRGG